MSGSIGGRFVLPLQQIVDPTGVPYVGAQAFFYATGTSTFQNTYADVLLTVPNPNPVLTNSAGLFPNIFMVPAPAYRVRVEDPTGAVIYDCDPVSSLPTTGYGNYIPGMVPIGGIMPFAGGTPPTGWLFCDGSAVSRTVFAPLFAAIGSTFGAGDGATTFNVPDLRGTVPAGLDTMGGIAAGRLTSGGSGVDGATLGASGGSELLANHNHTLIDPGHVHTAGSHFHGFTGPGAPPVGEPITGTDVFLPGGGLATTFPRITQTDTASGTIGSATTGITINATGGGSSANVQPSLITLYIILAA